MSGELKKILSMVYVKKDFKILYENKDITISFRDTATRLYNPSLEEAIEVLGETPTRCTKEARALAELVKLMDDLTGIGYVTAFKFEKKKRLELYVANVDNNYKSEILDVDLHSYGSFVTKLVKLKKDIKKWENRG